MVSLTPKQCHIKMAFKYLFHLVGSKGSDNNPSRVSFASLSVINDIFHALPKTNITVVVPAVTLLLSTIEGIQGRSLANRSASQCMHAFYFAFKHFFSSKEGSLVRSLAMRWALQCRLGTISLQRFLRKRGRYWGHKVNDFCSKLI